MFYGHSYCAPNPCRNVTGGGKRGHIVADTLLLMMFLGWANERDTKHLFCVHAAQTGKHLLRTQNVSATSNIERAR